MNNPDTRPPLYLNRLMETDHVVQVHPDGTVTDAPPSVYAPELHDGELMQGGTTGTGWTLMDGYSNQHSYSGPIMHPSEFIGGGLERDIRAEPGYYVTLVDHPSDGGEPDGWAVARKDIPDERDAVVVETAADRVAAFLAAYQANETRGPSIMTVAGAATNHQDMPLLAADVAEVVTPELRLVAAMRVVTADERAEDRDDEEGSLAAVTFRCEAADEIVRQLGLNEDGLEEMDEKLDRLYQAVRLARDRVGIWLHDERSARRRAARHARNLH
jgi:hypothetical protein